MKYFWKILKWLRKFTLYKVLKLRTHGVRVIVRDGEKILLIKHPYDNFWVFPGGGVKKNESNTTAAKRETLEEVNLEVNETDFKKLGEYFNNKEGKKDYITVFVTNSFIKSQKNRRLIDKIEVQKMQWFDIKNLPNISSATQRRLDEISKNEYSRELRKW